MIDNKYPELVGADLVYQVPPETILESFVDGNYTDTELLRDAIVAQRNGDLVEVRDYELQASMGLVFHRVTESQSRPGIHHYTYYRHTSGGNSVKYHCTCEGFQYHGNCKH